MEGLLLIRMRGIVGAAGGELAGEPHSSSGIDGKIAADGQVDMGDGIIQADAFDAALGSYEHFVGIGGESTNFGARRFRICCCERG